MSKLTDLYVTLNDLNSMNDDPIKQSQCNNILILTCILRTLSLPKCKNYLVR